MEHILGPMIILGIQSRLLVIIVKQHLELRLVLHIIRVMRVYLVYLLRYFVEEFLAVRQHLLVASEPTFEWQRIDRR